MDRLKRDEILSAILCGFISGIDNRVGGNITYWGNYEEYYNFGIKLAEDIPEGTGNEERDKVIQGFRRLLSEYKEECGTCEEVLEDILIKDRLTGTWWWEGVNIATKAIKYFGCIESNKPEFRKLSYAGVLFLVALGGITVLSAAWLYSLIN